MHEQDNFYKDFLKNELSGALHAHIEAFFYFIFIFSYLKSYCGQTPYSFVNLFIQTSLLCTSYNVKIVPMGFILFFTNYPSTGTCLVAFRLFQAYFCSFTLVIDMLALSILNHLEATQEQYNNTKK